MKTIWTKGLETDQAKEIKMLFQGSAILRRRLSDILAGKAQAVERARMRDSEYDSANWAYKQADSQGYKRAMSEILSILE